jgi:hypothetical protein
MGDELIEISEAGIAAKHPPIRDVQTLVAPATSKQHNTIIAGILPVACWRLKDVVLSSILRFLFRG